ncbi:NAD-P-binding protein [Mycena belliarum]|uniref:NAD-P-binding protein n=1 Tax=Mycena belliarum TaxID=1033014 RepID=A0AAD6TZ56_9AGAR|nr:NAD-P-binding protein [Mycena belliae]
MPSPAAVKESNAALSLSYVPVAVFVGGTSGVGQAMAEAFARYLGGRAHIIVVGRNEHAAADILAHLPKPAADEAAGWTHEFVPCDVSLMANVRAACAAIRAKVARINFLVLTAGYSSMVNVALTSEGLDLHLAIRYYQRYVFIRELLPLLENAHALGEDAKVMSVLGAGRGSPKRPLDLANLGNTVKPRAGRFAVANRSMIMSSDYTDAMLAVRTLQPGLSVFNSRLQHFAARNPGIAFTHISPGVVRTATLAHVADFEGLLTPLSWLINWLLPFFAVSQVRVPRRSALHVLICL